MNAFHIRIVGENRAVFEPASSNIKTARDVNMAWSTKDDRPKTDGSGNLQDESVQARDQDQF